MAKKNSLSDIKKTLILLEEEGEETFLAGAQWRVLRALKQVCQTNSPLCPGPDLIYRILHPSRLSEAVLPVEFKGKVYLCLGVRAWFDNGKLHQPGEIVKGGIRFLSVKPKIDGRTLMIADEMEARKLMLDDVMALGLEMLAKNSGTNFSHNVLEHFGLTKKVKILKRLDLAGGAKGVIVAPRSLHEKDHNLFVRKALEVFGYKLGLMRVVGWDRDVPAGDIGTTGSTKQGSVLDGFVDGYQKAIKDLGIEMPRDLQLGVITGKTANNRYQGNPARAVSTGFGTVEALNAWAEDKKIKTKDLVVVFDGAGNAALPAAKFLINSKIKVVGLTDSRGALLVKKGLISKDLEEISQVKAKRDSLADWAKGKKKAQVLKNKQTLWQQSGMNVLFVSSDAMIINERNVDLLPKGLLIVDGANGPVTPKAELKLSRKRIDHLTGSFANSGGVIGSLIEWVANVGNLKITEKQSKEYISHTIRTNYKEMRKLVDKGIVNSLADAFYYMAMERYIKKWLIG